LLDDRQSPYRRADSRQRGLMNAGYFATLYVDGGDITNGVLQPVSMSS
jgi:hypothetical protein